MATTKRLYVFATFFLACAATALLVAAYATSSWLTSELQPRGGVGLTGAVIYGLFTGSFSRGADADSEVVSTIYLECVAEQNACAWSCQDSPELRQQEVLRLLYNRTKLETGCPIKTGPRRLGTSSQLPARRPDRADETSSGAPETFTASPDSGDAADSPFVNMGLWLSTLIFLSLGLLLTVMSALLSLLNTASNPTVPVFAVMGLFYWNGGAAVADLLTLILWGVQYAVTLADNVAFTDVIIGDYVSDGLAALGYSYWLVLVAMFVSISNIAVLGFREYLLRIEPPPPAPPSDLNTDAILLY